jgi:hypothetical protein
MESKCPCCGGNRDSGFAAESFSCIDCMFMCETKDLPRIAAAMDLARTEVNELKAYHVPLERLDAAMEAADGMVEQARERVLEAFGGE